MLTQEEADLFRFIKKYRTNHYTLTKEEFDMLMSVVERVPRPPPSKTLEEIMQDTYIATKGDWESVASAVLEYVR